MNPNTGELIALQKGEAMPEGFERIQRGTAAAREATMKLRLAMLSAAAAASGFGAAVSTAAAQPVVDPMDTPLPCDVKVGNGTHRKGTPLRTLVVRMKMLHEAAFGPEPTQAQKDANLAELQGRMALFTADLDAGCKPVARSSKLAAPPAAPEPLSERVAQLEAALRDCAARMDRARDILTDGKPTPQCHWGMLDTNAARAILAGTRERT